MSDGLQIVGKNSHRVDSVDKVTGKAVYTTDIKFPGMLYGKVLRSPYPHASILHVDISRASRLLGVKAIVTGRDFKFTYGTSILDQPYYCWDKVRYIGDPVVGVAAVDEETAEEALYLIKVEYEELPAILDVVEAMKSGCPLVHENVMAYRRASNVHPVPGTNICGHAKIRKGDVEKGFREADEILEDTFNSPAVQHCHLEPHVSVAQVNPSGKITIWSSCQFPHMTRRELALSLGISVNKIRIVAPEVGGGFGGKHSMRTEALGLALAMKVKDYRPVKVLLTREEEFSATSGVKHPSIVKVKTGVKRDGRLIARKAELIFDKGAYADYGPGSMLKYAVLASAGPYEIPNVWADSYSVYTNKMVSSMFRGVGTNHSVWAVESHMDNIASKLGIDPIELRLKNLLKDGSSTVTGQRLEGVGVRECLLKVREAIGCKETVRRDGYGRGIALTQHLAMHPASSGAVVEVNEDGTACVLSSTVDIGQGSETIISQIAAETLGMNLEDIRVSTSDTDMTPFDNALSSRITFNTGNAVKIAAMDARRQLLKLASERLDANPEDLEVRKGVIWVRGKSERKVLIKSLPLGYGGGRPIVGQGSFYVENPVPMDPATGQSSNPVAFWMFAAQGVEVQVDRETGKIEVLRVVSAHDVGKAINPLNCQQQVEGAIGMGIGVSLMEEIKSEAGKVKNPNFADYKMPTAKDMPEMVPIIVETPQCDGPYGARGLGEGAVAPTPPAIANAIFDAIGVRIKDLPITPDKILRELRRKNDLK